jgi:phage terminase large subunit-like protein
MNVAELTDDEVLALYYDWDLWARASQKTPPGEWLAWLLLAGRGFGKTRVGAEWIRSGAENGYRRMALVGATSSDVRDTMVEGESGILAISPDAFRPRYEPSKRRLIWPNGAMAVCFTADEPDRLRGPQHDRAWCDEIAAWRYANKAWDNLLLGLRLGSDPRAVVTTTPRPIRLLREMIKDPTVRVTSGSTYENLDNLAPAFKQRILARYEGTTIGRQELYAELLSEMPGSLWLRSTLDANRVQEAPELKKIVVSVDPAVTANEDSDETGIIVGGLGVDNHAYVLDLIKALLKTIDETVAHYGVHVSRGKHIRAEPVAALYEQGRVHHVGVFPELEDEQCNWVPGTGKSPNRIDGLVQSVTAVSPAQAHAAMNLDIGGKKREMP